MIGLGSRLGFGLGLVVSVSYIHSILVWVNRILQKVAEQPSGAFLSFALVPGFYTIELGVALPW